MSNLLEVLRTHSEERKAASERAYQSLVVNLADGGDESSPDPDDLLAVITEAGRTVAMLEADVRRRKGRLEAAVLLGTLPGIEREKASIEHKRANLLEDLEQVKNEYRVKIGHQDRILRGLMERTREAEAARRHLEQTADPDLLAQIDALAGEHGHLAEQVGRLERDLVETEKVARRPMPAEPTFSDRRALGGNGGYLQEQINAIDAERAAISRAIALRDQLREKLDKARPRLEELAARLKDLRGQLLIP
jgi:DNA repair exonuclease SbcCD ATPase subunit